MAYQSLVNEIFNENAILTIGQTLDAVCIVSPSNADDTSVTWKSSDNSVATVSSKGVIKGKKAGTAVITAQSVADNTQNASIKVTVVAKKIANKVLKLKENKAKLDTKGQKAQVEIKKYTKETTDLVHYKVMSGNKYIRVNKYGKITCKRKPNNKNAKAKIRVKCGTKKKIVNVTVSKKK